MNVIIYTNSNGGLSIVVPAVDVASAMKDVPNVERHIIDHTTLPQSRRWRNAWLHTNGIVSIDLTRAKAVRLAELGVEALAIREAIKEALVDGDNIKAAALRLALAKYKAAVISDLPNDLATLDQWRPT